MQEIKFFRSCFVKNGRQKRSVFCPVKTEHNYIHFFELISGNFFGLLLKCQSNNFYIWTTVSHILFCISINTEKRLKGL